MTPPLAITVNETKSTGRTTTPATKHAASAGSGRCTISRA